MLHEYSLHDREKADQSRISRLENTRGDFCERSAVRVKRDIEQRLVQSGDKRHELK